MEQKTTLSYFDSTMNIEANSNKIYLNLTINIKTYQKKNTKTLNINLYLLEYTWHNERKLTILVAHNLITFI